MQPMLLPKLKHLSSIGENKIKIDNPIIEIKIDKKGKKITYYRSRYRYDLLMRLKNILTKWHFSGAEEFLEKYKDSAK